MIRLKPPQSCGKSPRSDTRQGTLNRTQSTSLSRQVSWRDRCHGDHDTSKRPINGLIHYGDNGYPEKLGSKAGSNLGTLSGANLGTMSGGGTLQGNLAGNLPSNLSTNLSSNLVSNKPGSAVCRHSSIELNDPIDLDLKGHDLKGQLQQQQQQRSLLSAGPKTGDILRIQITNELLGDPVMLNGKDAVTRRTNYLNRS